MDGQNQKDENNDQQNEPISDVSLPEWRNEIHDHENPNTSEQDVKTEVKKQSIIEKYYSMNTSDTIAFYQLIASIVGGVIGIGLFTFTIFTFLETLKANSISQSANAISQNNYELAKQNADASTKENNERFEIQKKEVEAQIAALTEQARAMKTQVQLMKEQFEIENTPFLSITHFDTIRFEPNQPFYIVYFLENLGKYPAKTVRSASIYFFMERGEDKQPDITNKFNDELKKFTHPEYVSNTYVSNRGPVAAGGPYPGIITEEVYTLVMKGYHFLFFGVETIYEDLINHRKFRLRHLVKTTFSKEGKPHYQVIIFENEPMPEDTPKK